jgi:hypothetical protein
MRMALTLGAVLALAGCAVATTGVVPRAEGMSTVTRQGSGAWVSTQSLTAQASQDAHAHCATQRKQVKILHVKEIPAGPIGRWPESEVLFRCE